MKCVICHSDDIRETEVNEEISRGNDVILVSVHALKCSQCGERYFDQRTVRYLERVRNEVKSNPSLDLKQIGKVLKYEDLAQAA